MQRDRRHNTRSRTHRHVARPRSQTSIKREASSHASKSRGTCCSAQTLIIASETSAILQKSSQSLRPAPTSSVYSRRRRQHSLLNRRIVARLKPLHLPKVKKLSSTPIQQSQIVVAKSDAIPRQCAFRCGHAIGPNSTNINYNRN